MRILIGFVWLSAFMVVVPSILGVLVVAAVADLGVRRFRLLLDPGVLARLGSLVTISASALVVGLFNGYYLGEDMLRYPTALYLAAWLFAAAAIGYLASRGAARRHVDRACASGAPIDRYMYMPRRGRKPVVKDLRGAEAPGGPEAPHAEGA